MDASKLADGLRQIIALSKEAEELAMADEGAQCLIEFRAISAKAEELLSEVSESPVPTEATSLPPP